MLRLSRQLVSILLLPVALLVGCVANVEAPTNDHTNIKSVSYDPAGQETPAPVEISYVIDNPIEIINIDASDNSEHQQYYFQISGLIDQSVEDKINGEIKALYEQMVPYATGEKLAPYRGIQSVVKPDKKVSSSSLSVIPHYNSNQVLSVVAYVTLTYNRAIHDYVYLNMIESLNFDLNTGRTFLIEDVFTNDVNGLEIVNDAINSEITHSRMATHIDYDEYSSLNLVAPFKGIDHGQKFYVSHDGIHIVIDHNNPEFNLGFSNAIVVIPFYSQDKHIAITERFYDENNSIFAKDAVSKRFLPDRQLKRSYESDSYHQDGTDWYVTMGRPESLSQNFIEIMETLRGDQKGRVALLSQESPISFVESSIHAYGVGSYINISTHLYIGRTNEGQWEENCYVYLKTGEPIGLGDVFVEGYDYSTLIKNRIDQALKEYGLSQAPNHKLSLEDVMFKVDHTGISFVTKTFEWGPGNKHPLHFDISYEEIGSKNLRVFNQ